MQAGLTIGTTRIVTVAARVASDLPNSAGRPSTAIGVAGSLPAARVANPARRAGRSCRGQSGASLIEALVAVGLIAGALVAVVDVAGLSVRALATARDRSMCTLIAAQKIEQLLAETSRPPDSPAGTLDADTAGYVEYLDAHGRVAGTDHAHEGAVYARRWSIERLDRDSRVTVVLVRAGFCRGSAAGGSCAALANGSTLAAARGEAW